MSRKGMFTLRLHGVDKLKRQLAAIEQAVVKKELKRIARESFKPVLTSARQNAPEDTGLLRKRIKLRVVNLKDGGVAVGLYLSTNPKTLKGAKKPEARNWAWFEKGIPSRGIPAQPFFRPALDSNASKVVDTLRKELRDAILKALKTK